jgi:hypothetical protein
MQPRTPRPKPSPRPTRRPSPLISMGTTSCCRITKGTEARPRMSTSPRSGSGSSLRGRRATDRCGPSSTPSLLSFPLVHLTYRNLSSRSLSSLIVAPAPPPPLTPILSLPLAPTLPKKRKRNRPIFSLRSRRRQWTRSLYTRTTKRRGKRRRASSTSDEPVSVLSPGRCRRTSMR